MSRSSACEDARGQVHPIPALVAVLCLTLALTAYAAVTTPLQSTDDRSNPAVPALTRIETAATTGAVLYPDAIDSTHAVLPGYNVTVTVTTIDGTSLTTGHRPPARGDDVDTATTTVAVGLDDAVVPGTLRVEVWS